MFSEIRHGMVGARGWKADYAILVTWERMAYGGAPKITELNEYERAKRWVNGLFEKFYHFFFSKTPIKWS